MRLAASCPAIRPSCGAHGRAWRTLVVVGLTVWIFGCASTRPGPVRVDGSKPDLERFKADRDACERTHDTLARHSRMTYGESAAWLGKVSQGMACMAERGWKYGER